MTGALTGLRVIDSMQHLAGPSCAMFLADMGAEVIKIERVGRSVLTEVEPSRLLYLAVPQRVYESLFAERFGQLILHSLQQFTAAAHGV